MRVIFDYQVFAEHVYGGISRYFCSLASALQGMEGVQPRIVAPLYVNQYLKELPPSLRCGVAVTPLPGTRRAIRAASAYLFKAIAPALRPQLIHESYYKREVCGASKAPRVLTVFDMIHERFPGTFSPSDSTHIAKAAAVRRAQHILCISENTKRDLMEICGVASERITVTYLATDRLPAPDPAHIKLFGEGRPYLLHVGGRFGYKNFNSLLKAYAGSHWLKENFRVVAFGGGGFMNEEREFMRQLGLQTEDVSYLSGSDQMLGALYRNAAVLVYPSLYEGFGIPPLEAMAQDCPVVCSNAASIPEVVAEAGEYFDPADPESQKTALINVLQSPTRRQELVEAGRKRHAQFSWERCAQQTLGVYRQVIQ